MAESHLNRRTLLATTGTLAAGLVAGCSSGDGDGGDPTEAATPTPTEAPTEAPATTEAPTDTPAEGSSDGSSDGGSSGDTRRIDVVMRSFEFEPGSDDPIVVQQGQTIKLCTTSEDDGIGAGHGLGIPAYDVNLAPVVEGVEKCTTFTADEAGEFRIECTVQCSQPGAGSGHEDMIGTFIVE